MMWKFILRAGVDIIVKWGEMLTSDQWRWISAP